jgi:hypothetical protein
MTKLNPETPSPLRQPKQKKTLGLAITSRIGMPHEHLIHPEIEPSFEGSIKPSSIPSNEGTSEPIAEPSNKPSFRNVSLDATHSGSEARLYSVLYRETISKGKASAWTTVPALSKSSGIRAENTVRTAIAGLLAKQSIKLLDKKSGPGGGWHILVYDIKTIFQNRKVAGIVIDERTKHVIPSIEGSIKPSSEGIAEGSVNEGIEPSKIEGSLNTKINTYGPTSSSAPSARDDDKLAKVRTVFEQLSNGGTWRADRDEPTYASVAHVGIFHIVLGLCYSVAKSPEHRMSSLAYAVPSILKHAEDMAEFPPEQLIDIAYRTKRKTLNCIQTGNWTIPEWES